MSVFLSDSLILILSVLAVISAVTSKFVTHKHVSAAFSVIGFLLVLASITYALLLGAELTEVLIYVLAFSLLWIITLLPSVRQSSDNVKNITNSPLIEEENGAEADKENEGNEGAMPGKEPMNNEF